MKLFLKIGEILFKIIGIILILLVLLLEKLSDSKKTIKSCNFDTNKRTFKITTFKNTQKH